MKTITPFIAKLFIFIGSSACLHVALAQEPPAAPARPPVTAETPAPPRGPQGPQVTSPEVSADRRITFRILAPKADAIGMRAGDIPQLARPNSALNFTKNGEGVWEATTDPVPAGAYRYTFMIDGVPVMDPRNPKVSESNTNAWSLVVVPGSDVFDLKEVPHGAVESVNYYSTALGRFRRMHVYTPRLGPDSATADRERRTIFDCDRQASREHPGERP